MHLTPKETDRLLLFLAAELARKHRSQGLRLNYPEARALIADEICEGARAGRSVAELMELGAQVLTADDVVTGVPEMVRMLQVEAMFPDGQKLVTVHEPIPSGDQPTGEPVPGEVIPAEADVEINAGRESTTLTVANTGDRPIQVGSHFHFFEANRALSFDRRQAFGMRLDIPAGTSVRFEPGDERDVDLVALGGDREVHGLNRLTQGPTMSDEALARAAALAHEQGFEGAQ